MTKVCGSNNYNTLVMLLTALVFASMIVNAQCRHITTKDAEEEDEHLEMKWVLEMSSRDEMVQMAGYGEEKLSTILITGAVVCNKACLADKHQLQLPPQPISGKLIYYLQFLVLNFCFKRQFICVIIILSKFTRIKIYLGCRKCGSSNYWFAK